MIPALAQILLVWFSANYLPHIAIILIAGKPYFAMGLVQGTLLEMAIMGLNLTLPIAAILVFSKVKPSSKDISFLFVPLFHVRHDAARLKQLPHEIPNGGLSEPSGLADEFVIGLTKDMSLDIYISHK
jgi:hypothetical protein